MKVLHAFKDLDYCADGLSESPQVSKVEQPIYNRGSSEPKNLGDLSEAPDIWLETEYRDYQDDFDYLAPEESDYDDFEDDDYYRHRDWRPSSQSSGKRW